MSTPTFRNAAPVIGNYLQLFDTRVNPSSGNEEYTMEIIIDKKDTESLNRLISAMDAACAKGFKNKARLEKYYNTAKGNYLATGKPSLGDAKFFWPLQDGDVAEREDQNTGEVTLLKKSKPHYAGKWFFRAKSFPDKSRPHGVPCVGPTKQLIKEEGHFKNGDNFNVIVGMSAFDKPGLAGIGCYINAVQFHSTGETIAGAAVEDQFGMVETADEDWING